MSALKTWALTFLVWMAMATLARANPTSILWDWTAWVAGSGIREGSLGSVGSSGGESARSYEQPANHGSSSTSTFSQQQATAFTPDAFLNFGTAPYAEQSVLTVGVAKPWYTSAAVANVFGRTPTVQEQQDFIEGVSSNVQQTFEQSGLTGSHAVSLTTDPGAGAHHGLSVVSGLSYGANPSAIGISDVGANGFSFIDKLSYAKTPQELEWAVAHNVAHELMHAFGVGEHLDQTGNYLDAATADWEMLIDPKATLSPAAVDAIVTHSVGRFGDLSLQVGRGVMVEGEQEILAPVPEPTTIAVWGLAATALLLHQRRRVGRPRAA